MKNFKKLLTQVIIVFFIFASGSLYTYRLPDYLFTDNHSIHNFKVIEPVKLTIIIDDIGNSFFIAKKIWDINKNITLSILPFLKYSKTISEFAKKNNLPVMLHFPMEPLNYSLPLENFFLKTDMPDDKFYENLHKVLNSIPYYQGINNHMGSKFTSDEKSLKKFFSVIKYKNVFFIDSRTSPQSLAAKISLQFGILTGIRDIFIDNKLNVNYILKQLEKAYKIAEEKRYAIVIGHPHRETIKALRLFFKKYKNIRLLSANRGLKYFQNYERAIVLKKESH